MSGSSIAVVGSVVTATFQIASGCTKVSVSLVTNRILPTGQTIFASSSRTFDAGGPYMLTVSPPPDCPYESALVAQGQIVASVSGSNPCTVPTEPTSQQPPPSQGSPCRQDGGHGGQLGGGQPQGGGGQWRGGGSGSGDGDRHDGAHGDDRGDRGHGGGP